MAKTMDEAKSKRLIKAIGKRVYDERWFYFGTEFGAHDLYKVGDADIYARFTVSGFAVKAYIDGERLGTQDCVRMFVGANAMQEAIEWTADRMLAISEEVTERTAPYKAAYEMYQRLMRGE